MKTTTFSLILLLFVSACSHKTESNITDIPQAKAAAQKSAEQWLALVDAGNYAESWKTAAGYFQTAVPQDQWDHTISTIRGPLGDLVSRQLKSAQYTKGTSKNPVFRVFELESSLVIFDKSFFSVLTR